jgi:hypothetical protein
VAQVAYRAPNGRTLAIRERTGNENDAVLCVERDDTGRVCVLEGPPVLPLPPLP